MLMDDVIAIEIKYPSINQGEISNRWYRIKEACCKIDEENQRGNMSDGSILTKIGLTLFLFGTVGFVLIGIFL